MTKVAIQSIVNSVKIVLILVLGMIVILWEFWVAKE